MKKTCCQKEEEEEEEERKKERKKKLDIAAVTDGVPCRGDPKLTPD